jgi:hypothetical protein
MLLQEIKNIRTDKNQLKNFGVALFVFLSIFAAISFWKAGGAYRYLAPMAILVLAAALTFPNLLKVIYLPWMAVATVIGWVMTRIILSLFFYLIITPFSLILKLSGKDLLDEKIEPEKKSYWVLREKKTITKEELERQF